MQEKRKILYVITKGNFGGAQRYVYDLATNLPKDEFEATVVCGYKESNTLVAKLTEQNINTIILESAEREINLRKDWLTFRQLIGIIRTEKPSVVHLNSSKIGLLGSLAISYIRLKSKNYKLKSIFTSHGWAFNEQKRSAFSKLIFYIGHYLTVLLCDVTIAVSEQTKNDIVWLPFISNKIKVVYNGISPFKVSTKKEAWEILIKNTEKQTVIFSIAELHHNKGFDVALRGIALLSSAAKEQIQYYIAGIGEEQAKLEKLAEQLEIKNIVHFFGFLENAKKFLPGAKIFLLPSRTENLPYAILEAGLCGLPIIATSVGGIPEIIHDMQNGILVHPNNPKEIAEAVLYLLGHKEKQKEFGAEIKKTITNFFSFEKMLSETIKIYKN